MPQFHETGYGRDFFQYQLPELIKQLTRVANSLERFENQAETSATTHHVFSARVEMTDEGRHKLILTNSDGSVKFMTFVDPKVSTYTQQELLDFLQKYHPNALK